VRLAIAPDERGRLRALIEEGLGLRSAVADWRRLHGEVRSGGAGSRELKAEFYFTGAEIQPGRPVVFGSCGADAPARDDGGSAANTRTGVSAPHNIYFFGLPGNPVSTMVTFELFARPMIEALAGMTPQRLIFLRARLKSEIRTKTGLKRFFRRCFRESLRMLRWSWLGGRVGRHCCAGAGELLRGDSSGPRTD